MKTMFRLLLIACMALPFAACKKEQAADTAAMDAPVSVPANPADDAAWKKYLADVVGRNLGNSTGNPFVYYLTSQSNPKFNDDFAGQKDQVEGVISRGVPGGSLLAFGSPESAKMAEIIENAFAGVSPDSFKGVRVLFIGQATEKDRVQAAVAPSGAEYVFIEAK